MLASSSKFTRNRFAICAPFFGLNRATDFNSRRFSRRAFWSRADLSDMCASSASCCMDAMTYPRSSVWLQQAVRNAPSPTFRPSA
ncbi:hypothetical protein [Streptomyces humi]